MTKKFKKAISLMVTCCMLFTLVVPMNSKAAENITSSTTVTKDNIYKVLNYLGLSSSVYTPSSSNDFDIMTVGDLQEALKEAKSQPSSIRTTATVKTDIPSFTSKAFLTATAVKKGAKSLDSISQFGDIEITLSATGQYTGKKWTDVTGLGADVDTDDLIFSYKITSKSLDATVTSSKITMTGTLKIATYVGVGGFGIIKIATQNAEVRAYFYASNYL